MPEGFDRSQLGLRRLHVRVFEGLIFVNFADDPPAFRGARARSGRAARALRPRHARRSRTGRTTRSPATGSSRSRTTASAITAQPAHPEYSVGHGRAIPDAECDAHARGGDGSARRRSGSRSTRSAAPGSHAGGFGLDRGFDRYPLLRGHLTGSRDGKPVAPLLGTHHGLRRRHDRPASRPDDLRARVLRSRRAVPLHAARPAQHGLRDHLARQRDGRRRQGLRPRRR